MLLSLATILFYGYALGALLNFIAGKPKPLVLALGLILGTVCAIAAVKIWSKEN